MIATGDDLRYPTTTGATANTAMRMQHRYLDRVMAAATADEAAMAAMTDALFLVARPESLFKPSVMWRALRHGRPRPVNRHAPESHWSVSRRPSVTCTTVRLVDTRMVSSRR